MRHLVPVLLLLLLPLFFGGCTHVISGQGLASVDPEVPFEAVFADPDRYAAKTLLLAGLIVSARIDREGSDLEILNYTPDRWGRPVSEDPQQRRFLVRTSTFLDQTLFREGREVTLVGRVSGSEVRTLRGSDYRYPVFAPVELYPWSPPVEPPPYYYWPAYHPYYGYPYYSPPWYDPFWYPYDPTWYRWPHSRP